MFTQIGDIIKSKLKEDIKTNNKIELLKYQIERVEGKERNRLLGKLYVIASQTQNLGSPRR